MRLVLAAAVIALLVVLGAGLLPPVFAQGSLDDATLAAARAGSSVLQDGGTASAEAAALRSIAGHPDMDIVNMGVVAGTSGTFRVTVDEHVHTFMDGIPDLTGWFLITSTQESALGQ
jgi:hypothetical protein